jgi:glycosyltransferase involved in cell wall biosynthesis
MEIAYLVNQYPSITHTFIRREIAEVEKLGIAVFRVSVRPCSDDLPDAADQRERDKTVALLARGPWPIVAHAFWLALRRPAAWLRGVARAFRMGLHSHAGLGRHLAYLAEACSLVRLLERHGIDHVHVHFGTNAASVALLAQTLAGPSFSMTVHGPGEFDSPELLHLPEKVRAARFVAAVSHFARSQILRWTDPVDWDKVHVVRCAVAPSFLDEPDLPVPEAPRLVCVGRLGHSKGHALLLEVAARLLRDGVDFELVLIGDGPLRGRLETMVQRLRLAEKVCFLGWCDERGVREAILNSRVLVLPSFGEGLPVVLMEALALGRPAIATCIAGIPELLQHGESGWLIRAGDEDALEQALREALATPPEALHRMGLAGRAAVRERHDAMREATKLAGLFRVSDPELLAPVRTLSSEDHR